MIRLLPKLTEPAYAVKLKEDIIGEKGQWLLIIDDRPMIMSDADVRAAFKFSTGSVPEAQPAVSRASTRPHEVRVAVKRMETTINGKRVQMGAQVVRVLYAAFQHENKHGVVAYQSGELREYLNAVDGTQITARLGDARTLGLCEEVTRKDNRIYWRLTNNGRLIARDLGERAQAYAEKQKVLV